MSRRTHTASTILLTVVVLLMQSGCRKKATQWDSVQEATEGKTAAESSRDRLEAEPNLTDEVKIESRKYDDDNLGELPAFNPDAAPAVDNAPIDWKPKALQSDPATENEIELTTLIAGDPLPGSEFNKFFPPQIDGYDMVAKQEKAGFAQYSLRQGGEEIGQLSITDLRSNPPAALKFETPDMGIASYPAKKDGSKGTTLLVAGRFQIKIRSPEGQLNQQDRVAWLEKFDLNGIEQLGN